LAFDPTRIKGKIGDWLATERDGRVAIKCATD
jgi:hypothetical protein